VNVIELAALGCFTLAFLTRGDVSVWFLFVGVMLFAILLLSDDD
jgi:hypothetical protein